jgi:hypothetical protein
MNNGCEPCAGMRSGPRRAVEASGVSSFEPPLQMLADSPAGSWTSVLLRGSYAEVVQWRVVVAAPEQRGWCNG